MESPRRAASPPVVVSTAPSEIPSQRFLGSTFTQLPGSAAVNAPLVVESVHGRPAVPIKLAPAESMTAGWINLQSNGMPTQLQTSLNAQSSEANGVFRSLSSPSAAVSSSSKLGNAQSRASNGAFTSFSASSPTAPASTTLLQGDASSQFSRQQLDVSNTQTIGGKRHSVYRREVHGELTNIKQELQSLSDMCESLDLEFPARVSKSVSSSSVVLQAPATDRHVF